MGPVGPDVDPGGARPGLPAAPLKAAVARWDDWPAFGVREDTSAGAGGGGAELAEDVEFGALGAAWRFLSGGGVDRRIGHGLIEPGVAPF